MAKKSSAGNNMKFVGCLTCGLALFAVSGNILLGAVVFFALMWWAK